MHLFYRGIRRYVATSGAILGCACLLFSGSAKAATYNAVNDFSLTANPNGSWSYLYGSNLLPTDVVGTGNTAGLDFWWDSQGIPNSALVGKNVTGAPITVSGTIVIPTDQLEMDPESYSNVDVRFTTPSAGTYTIAGDFLGIDTGEHSHPVAITQNGVVLFSDTIAAYGQSDTFSFSESLKAGDVLNFEDLTGATYTNLSTGLGVTISQASPSTAPEPQAFGLILAGMIALSLTTRRKFSR